MNILVKSLNFSFKRKTLSMSTFIFKTLQKNDVPLLTLLSKWGCELYASFNSHRRKVEGHIIQTQAKPLRNKGVTLNFL